MPGVKESLRLTRFTASHAPPATPGIILILLVSGSKLLGHSLKHRLVSGPAGKI